MRLITYKVHVPGGNVIVEQADLPYFVRKESSLMLGFRAWGHLPRLEQLNAVFESGSGDEGLSVITWEPFTISAQEHAELSEIFGKGKWVEYEGGANFELPSI